MLDYTNSDPDLITDDETWMYGQDPETKLFRHFPYNENPTRAVNATSFKFCFLSIDSIDSRGKFHACV
jgi:hypothetical protein